MRGGFGRHSVALLVLCILSASACDCGDERMRQLVLKEDLGVEVRGGVSCKGEKVRLRAVGFGGVPPYKFSWSPVAGISDPTSDSPEVPGDAARTYEVTVTDRQGLTATGVARVGPRSPPKARLAFTRGAELACSGDTLALDASASRDVDGQPVVKYRWDLAGRTLREGADATSGDFVPTAGDKVVLTITDARGCEASLEQPLTVRALPAGTLAFSQGSDRMCAGDVAALTANARDADGAPVATFAWDLDGDPNTIESHDATSGAYRPTGAPAVVTLTDGYGCHAQLTQPIDVGALPRAEIQFLQGSADECEGSSIGLAGTASVDAAGQPVASYAWDLDGDPATIEATGAETPAFAVSGTRTVHLTVADARGCRASAAKTLAARPAPRAVIGFTKGAALVCAGDAVVLNGAGSRDADGLPVAAYAWDLDDDGVVDRTSEALPPLTPGANRVVHLTVEDSHGCVASASQALTVRATPTVRVAFTSGRDVMCEGDRVTLDASGSRDADGRPVATFAWDLDGNRSTVETTSASTGSYAPASDTALVTVTDALGCSASFTQALRVAPAPTARIRFVEGADRVCAGTRVTVDGLASTDGQGLPVARYEWDLDGNAATVESTSGQPPSLVAAGAKTLRLTVYDAAGCHASDVADVIARPLPTARLAFTQGRADACAGDAVTLSAQGSLDADGQPPARYEWSYADAPGPLDPTATSTPSFVPTKAQTVRVRVVDAEGCTAEATQDVAPRALPTVRLGFLEGAAALCAGERVRLDASRSQDADGQALHDFAWDLDGNPASIESTAPATGAFAPGLSAQVTVTDVKGCRASASQAFDVDPLPTAAIRFLEGSARVCEGSVVTVDALDSVDGFGQPVARYEWDLDGDATTIESTARQPPALVPRGTEPIRLTVFDARGCKASTEESITARPNPIARISFTEGRADACTGDEVTLSGGLSRDADGNRLVQFEWSYPDQSGPQDPTSPDTAPFVPSRAQVATLRVVDGDGCRGEATQALTPRSLPKVQLAFARGAAFVCQGENVALTAAGSRDADGNPVAQYAWDLDGNASTIESTAATTADFAPVAPAHVAVVDVKGCRAETTQPLEVGKPPNAKIRYAQGASLECDGETIVLDGSASTTADGLPVAQYAWDLDGDATTVESTSASPPAFAAHGTRPIRLTVRDARGCSAQATDTVTARGLPTARITFAQGRADVCAGNAIALSASTSTDVDGRPVTAATWDWDGNPATVEASALTTNPFTPAGPLQVKVKVYDRLGCSNETTQTVAPRALPTALLDFAQGRANACAGDAIALSAARSIDADGRAPASFAWDLDGNGTTDATGVKSPAFVPASAATARVTVTDALGCQASATQALAPRALPVAQFAYLAGSSRVCSGDTISLDASPSRDADGRPPAAFSWDLDGNAATVESTSMLSGAFRPASGPVRLTVIDGQGCRASTSDTIDVGALPVPVIRFSQGAGQVCSGTRVSLDGTASHDAAGQPVSRYEWDFDGNPATAESTAAIPPDLTTTSGTQTLALKVFDARGCSAVATQQVTTNNLPRPRITFAAGRADVCAGGAVQLSGTFSTDGSGAPVASYAWDLDGNGSIDSSAATPAAFTPSGPRVAKLTVTDVNGCTGTVTQAIQPRPMPTAVATFTQGQAALCAGDSVALTAAASHDADGNPIGTFAWDLDGNASTVESTAVTTGTFQPASSAVRLTVTDAQGCTASVSQPLDVAALPKPVIRFTQGAAAVCQGGKVAVDGSGSTDAKGSPVAKYAWDFDGNPATVESSAAQPPAFAPSAAGQVRLDVTDARGCRASATQALNVLPLPTARIAFTQGRSDVCLGDGVTLSGTGSADAAGQPVASWSWDLDSNGTLDSSVATPPAFTPTKAQTAKLTVTDARGCTASATQAIAPRALPTASIRYVTGGPSVCAGAAIQLDGSDSRDADGAAITRYAWDLNGDGATDSTSASPPSFPANRAANIALSVTDRLGCAAKATTSLAVRARPIPAMSIADGKAFICDGDTVAMDGSASRDADGRAVSSYAWDLDGNRSTTEATTARTPDFLPSGPATLGVKDLQGCFAELTKAVPTGSPRAVYDMSGGNSQGTVKASVDIILVIDNSGSMTDEIQAVENSINNDFANIIGTSGIDYRVIAVTKHGSATKDQSICIRAPLSGTSCNPIPGAPVLAPRFFQYDVEIGSHNAYRVLLDTYAKPDVHNFAPNGWSGWLRPGATKAFVVITDDESDTTATDFDRQLLALSSTQFGTATSRNYLWYSIVGLKENTPQTAPYQPADALVSGRCGSGGTQSVAPGTEYQKLSKTTGALRFPECLTSSYGPMFQALAKGVVQQVKISCEFTVPTGPTAPDPSTLELEYAPGSGGPLELLMPVSGLASCNNAGFYLVGSTLELCPGTCTRVQADPSGSLTLTGCRAP